MHFRILKMIATSRFLTALECTKFRPGAYELREDSDKKLFFLSRYNHNHVLHRLLPQPKKTGYNLRQRTHDLTLPTDINAVTKQNFVYRMLFRDIY